MISGALDSVRGPWVIDLPGIVAGDAMRFLHGGCQQHIDGIFDKLHSYTCTRLVRSLAVNNVMLALLYEQYSTFQCLHPKSMTRACFKCLSVRLQSHMILALLSRDHA